MYILKIRRNGKYQQVALFKDSTYIKGMNFERGFNKQILLRLINKVDLNIDWEVLYANSLEGLKVCKVCGEYFKPSHRLEKYCSDYCRNKERKKQKRIISKKYRNTEKGKKTAEKYRNSEKGKKTKKEYNQDYYLKNSGKRLKKYYLRKRQLECIYEEQIKNTGGIPKGFNQIDNVKDLGNSITQNPIKNNDGEIDFKKEFERVKFEKKRLLKV